jgi:hypothetical protein
VCRPGVVVPSPEPITNNQTRPNPNNLYGRRRQSLFVSLSTLPAPISSPPARPFPAGWPARRSRPRTPPTTGSIVRRSPRGAQEVKCPPKSMSHKMVVYDTISSVLIQFHGVLCAMVFRRLSAQKNGDIGSIDVLFFWRLLGMRMTAWEINHYGIKQCECMHELLSLGDRHVKLGNSVPSLYIIFFIWVTLGSRCQSLTKFFR